MNPLDSVVRTEHDPENLLLKQELDGTPDVAIRYECFMYRRRVLHAGFSEYLDG